MMPSFMISRLPEMHFGAGKIARLPELAVQTGKRILLVTGAKSFCNSPFKDELFHQFHARGVTLHHTVVHTEPSPSQIDSAVKQFGSENIEVVLAIGGGSVLDAGKAISAMLPIQEPVKQFLEGVGNRDHPGKKIPFIAVPTTAGTGSEATKNAVLSEPGENGFKRSLRHNNFIPDYAVVDPALTISCSKSVTASGGMDAFTQLLESFLSTQANPVTDALALQGLSLISKSLLTAYHDGENLEARTDMSLAAYLSGVTLANAGLGTVHGLAGSIGGLFPVSHGIICSALMSAANNITVRELRRTSSNSNALTKYADVGKIFVKKEGKPEEYYVDVLLETIANFAAELEIPSLKACGISSPEFEKIIASSDNKNNPVKLTKEQMLEVLDASS